MAEKNMERTQIYLPKQLKQDLHKLASGEQSSLSELLRQAGQQLVAERKKKRRSTDAEFRKALKRISGIWKDRDPKDFEEIRRSADRRLDEWGV